MQNSWVTLESFSGTMRNYISLCV
uniref:Uncharacterized protein n=1 Tax=Arundo donax TaxID=35708 RepID=A0A0A8ZCD2_ARUDO